MYTEIGRAVSTRAERALQLPRLNTCRAVPESLVSLLAMCAGCGEFYRDL